MGGDIFSHSITGEYRSGAVEFGVRVFEDGGRLQVWIGQTKTGAGFLFTQFDDGKISAKRTSGITAAGAAAAKHPVSLHHRQLEGMSEIMPSIFHLFTKAAPQDPQWAQVMQGLTALVLQKAVKLGPQFGQCRAG